MRSRRGVWVGLVAIVVLVAGGIVVARQVVSPGSSAVPVVDGLEDTSMLTIPDTSTGTIPPISPTEPVTGHFTLGQETPVATQTVGASGGTIAGPGFNLQVPNGLLAADTNFAVTAAPITGNELSRLVTPITPLFSVDDGDIAFNSPVTITLAATIPAGATAMAFSYDDATGTITPLIPISQDATTLVAGTTHFSSMFGGLFDDSVEPTSPDSGFRPGVDDWQFPNYGSYIAPDGICEGKSVSEIWYYVSQKRKANAQLYGLTDNNGKLPKTPGLWLDDSQGYRFASTIQADPVADRSTYLSFKPTQAADTKATDRFTYNAFRTAITTTGQPQLVQIATDAGTRGHSMVVYRVTPDALFVADPNYPGVKNNPRWIPYDQTTGRLGPYSSGPNSADIAAHGATVYTRFNFQVPQASSSDAAIAAHWAEYQAGTAGDSRFPKFSLIVTTEEQAGETTRLLTNGYVSTEPELKVTLVNQDVSSHDLLLLRAFLGTSATPAAPAGKDITIKLQVGDNTLGFQEQGAKSDWKQYQYVDFERLTVTYRPSDAINTTPPGALAVRMAIAGQNARTTDLTDLKINMTGKNTFVLSPDEKRIKSLVGEIAAGGQSVTVTITYLDDPSVPAMASCPNVTVLNDIPLGSTDPTSGTRTFIVSGWFNIINTIQDSYPWINNKGVEQCMSTDGWHYNSDANPNPTIYVTLGN